MESFDYIVIGAGSSGCPVAAGLSADPQNTVLMLEAGPAADGFWSQTPAGMAKMYHHKVLNWNFFTTPMERLKGRRMYWPRGKALGGSGAINGMVFIRGSREDFDNWRALGNPGWGYDEVLPYFRKMESFEGGEDQYRGAFGPMTISHPVVKLPASYDFIEAAKAQGIPFTEDMNGAVHDGVGFIQHNIRNGKRCSAYNAFIEPVRDRRNLTIRTGCEVQRILFEGKTAIGIEVVQNGERRTIHARREVILSAGSLKSPQLLMLSGVGPSAELQRHGIEVIHASPGVGQNLQDHFYIHTGWRATKGSSYNANLAGIWKYFEGFRYLMTRKGYLALGSSQVAAFVKSSPDLDQADLQISFRPMSFQYNPDGTVAVESFPGLGVSVFQLRPSTTGTVTLRNTNPSDSADYTPHFLTNDYDVKSVISGIRQIRQIMSTEPIKSRVVAEEMPGAHVQTDDQIFRYMEESGNSAMHQVGTCKMGNDALAVVDARLRVIGVERLRVVDASIMPVMTSGNTNAPSIMIGCKAADMIAEDAAPRRQSAA